MESAIEGRDIALDQKQRHERIALKRLNEVGETEERREKEEERHRVDIQLARQRELALDGAIGHHRRRSKQIEVDSSNFPDPQVAYDENDQQLWAVYDQHRDRLLDQASGVELIEDANAEPAPPTWVEDGAAPWEKERGVDFVGRPVPEEPEESLADTEPDLTERQMGWMAGD